MWNFILNYIIIKTWYNKNEGEKITLYIKLNETNSI